MNRIPEARPFVRLRSFFAPAVLTLVLGLGMFACTEGRELTAVGGGSHAVRLAIIPRYHFFGSSSQTAPINLAHLTVVRASTRDTITGPITVPLDPSDTEWNLPVDFNAPEDGDNNVIVIIELLNLTNGVASVEWSGATDPITVVPGGETPPPRTVDLIPGPADNLTVVSVTVLPVTTRILEGDSVVMHAAVVGSGTPRVFWTPLDPTVATVGDDGVVHTLLPGVARIVGSAGVKADTETINILQRPASVSVTPSPVSFSSIGQINTVTGRVLDARGAEIVGDSVLYTIADAGVSLQTSRGSFQAVGPGSTTITASAASTPAVRVTVPVTVVPVATSITLSDNALEFNTVGETHRVTGVAHDAGGTVVSDVVLQYHSENPAVASVAADGTITARGAGATGIVVTTQSATARVAVSVNQRITAASVTPPTTLLESIDATAALTATARDGGGATVPGAVFTWSSSAPGVATVDASGVVTARSNGNATITAAAVGGASATASVSVHQKVTNIVTTPPTLTLQSIGETFTIAADPRDATSHSIDRMSAGLSWSSSAPAVATVDSSGLVTAVANGSATITVRSASGATTDVAVTVRQQAQSIVLTSGRQVLRTVGDTVHVIANVADGRGSAVSDASLVWSSSASSVATVDPQGVVHAVGSGVTTISATSGSIVATREFTVQLAVTQVDVSPQGANFTARGDSIGFTALARDASGNIVPDIAFTWQSSNQAVVVVDPFSGMVKAVGDGSADVIAIASNNVSGRAPVVVNRQLSGISIAPDSITLPRGSAHQFAATVLDAGGFPISGRVVTWGSSDTAVATVDGTGLVTAVSDSGRALITASSGGAIATAIVTTSAAIRSDGLSIIPGYDIGYAANCIPFGDNRTYQFTGFMYRNVPPFHMNAGDRIAFDLGSQNDVDLRRNIFFAPLNINPEPGGIGSDVVSQHVHATSWTQVVSDAHVPQNPRGNNVIGDYELIYTAEASFDFAGGGFAVGFQGNPSAYPDGGCDQVLVGTTSSDPSGMFYARFFSKPDLTLGDLDVGGGGNASAIGGIRIYSTTAAGPLSRAAGQRVQVVVTPKPTLPKSSGLVIGGGHD